MIAKLIISIILFTRIHGDILNNSPDLYNVNNQPDDAIDRFKHAISAILSPLLVLFEKSVIDKAGDLLNSLRIHQMMMEQVVNKPQLQDHNYKVSIPLELLSAIVFQILIEVPVVIKTEKFLKDGEDFEIDINTQTLSSLLKKKLPKKPIYPTLYLQTFYSPRLSSGSCSKSSFTNSNRSCFEILVDTDMLDQKVEILFFIDFEFKTTHNFTRLLVNSIYTTRYNEEDNDLIKIDLMIDFLNDILDLTAGVINNQITHQTDIINDMIGLVCQQARIQVADDQLNFSCTRN